MITKHHQLEVPLADWCITHGIVERNNVCLCLPLYIAFTADQMGMFDLTVYRLIFDAENWFLSSTFVQLLLSSQNCLSDLVLGYFIDANDEDVVSWFETKHYFSDIFLPSTIFDVFQCIQYTRIVHVALSVYQFHWVSVCMSFDTWVMVGSYTMRCQMYMQLVNGKCIFVQNGNYFLFIIFRII